MENSVNQRSFSNLKTIDSSSTLSEYLIETNPNKENFILNPNANSGDLCEHAIFRFERAISIINLEISRRQGFYEDTTCLYAAISQIEEARFLMEVAVEKSMQEEIKKKK